MVIDEVQTGFGRVGKKFWAHQFYEDGKPFISVLKIAKSILSIDIPGKERRFRILPGYRHYGQANG